jgi:hypothetical protein
MATPCDEPDGASAKQSDERPDRKRAEKRADRQDERHEDAFNDAFLAVAIGLLVAAVAIWFCKAPEIGESHEPAG